MLKYNKAHYTTNLSSSSNMIRRDSMKFSAILLYVDDEFPKIETFHRLLEIGNKRYRKGNYFYTVEQEIIDNQFYWMYFQYDNENLYAQKVIDIIDDSEKSNPRPKNQVEMRFQLFAFYDINQSILYVSDYSKKATITDYIGDMLQVKAQTKNMLKSVNDFINIIKKLKSVSFTQKRNLFTMDDNSIFVKQANLYGLDLPERSKIKLEYGDTPIGKIKNALQNWKRQQDSGQFEDIIIVGCDDNGFESSFNFSTMVSSINLDVNRDDNYRFDSDTVRIMLINELRGYHEEKI